MGDEVDRLLAAWGRECPDLDLEPMQIWSRVHRIALRFARVRREAFACSGLEPWEFDVLAALRKAGDPYQLSPGQLTHETHVTSGTMTNRVDRLVERGYVKRETHPADGRGVLVSLTAFGGDRVTSALKNLLQVEQKLLADFSLAEQQELVRSLTLLLNNQEKWASR